MESQSAPEVPAKPKPKKGKVPCPHANLWLRPGPTRGFKLPGFLRRLGLQQPDSRRNPSLWATRWVYGNSLLEQTLEIARKATSILILGDSVPWLSWEVARANPRAKVLALSGDTKRVDWAEQQFSERWPAHQDIVEVTTDYKIFLEPGDVNRDFDLIIWNFVPDPAPTNTKVPTRSVLLEAALAALKSGGRFIYYEATEPSHLNLERWGRYRHFWARLSGQMSDPWNQRRAIENRYLNDALRCGQDPALEAGLFQSLQAGLQIDHHRRTRPVVDTLLTGTLASRFWLSFFLIFLWDALVLKTGFMDGSARFAIFTKK